MNESMIRSVFEEKQQKLPKDVNEVYREIAEAVKTKPVERVTKEIVIAEASKLNTYCQNLEQTLRKSVCETMIAAGVPDNEVNIIWARAKRKTGTAQIEMCKEEKQNMSSQSSQETHGEQKPEKRADIKYSGPMVLAAGAAAEIIGYVFVPGMGKFAVVVKGIGLVLMAAGAYMTYEENKEKPRIRVSEEAGQQAYSATETVIDSICEKQCRLNTSILCTWLESVCEAVLQECRTQCG